MNKEKSTEEIVKNDYQEHLNKNTKKIGLASDHRGYDLKQKLTNYLNEKGYNVIDYGCNDKNKHDYPKYAFKLGEAIRDKKVEKGIAICGSGIGISIACNKVKKVRCAKVNTKEEAKYTRLDNDANIIALNGDMELYKAQDIVDTFLNTPFSNEERHIKRIKMVDDYKC
ncbi:MAG: RpiB/LacA/LacB family sugar-phosphate isomerase [Bacilli bacterium]|nr:RpiB/LacA/LacB family sugar-phosphate isomerase [Bacilli bacterium]